MDDIYRVFECQNGMLTELVFIMGKKNVFEYLESCYKNNNN